MKKAEQFNVQTDVNLVFQSRGKSYRMRLLIEEGLIFLGEVKSGKVDKESVLVLGEETEYTGEIVKDIPTKKKRKREKPCTEENKAV